MKNALLSAFCCVFLCSCQHDPGIPLPIGGKGGAAVLRVTPRHHGRQIDSCTIYIKYDAVNAPANGIYDDSAKCIQVDSIPVATFIGLRKGNYFLHGYGWDPKLSPPRAVTGGIAYTIDNEITQSYDLAISED